MFPTSNRPSVLLGFAILFTASVFFLIKIGSSAKDGPAAPASVTVTDAVSDALTGNNDGKAQPVEKLEGTITVSAAGSASNGTIVNIPLSNLLTLDNTFGTGGITVTPIVGNETYAATGNIQISQPDGANDLLANDIDPSTGNSASLTITTGTFSSAQCTGGCSGNVTINSDGSFTYISPGNFTGTDTFTYTVTSSTTGTATGTATVNVSDRVMFVTPTGASTNCRNATPCSLATADGVAAPTIGKDLVYVGTGTYNSAVFTMNASQKLIGQGVSFNQALTDATITLAANSVNPATPSASFPQLNNAGNIIVPNTNIYLSNVSLGPSNGAGIIGNGIASSTSTITSVNINATSTGQGLSITASPNATFNVSNVPIVTAGGTALTLSSVGTVNYTSGSINAVSAQAVNASSVALTATLTSVSAGGGTNGIALQNVTGTSTFGTGSLSNAAGDEFFVSGQNGSFTYNGTIASGSAHSVNVTGKTGGTVNFGGAITDTDTGVTLTSNAGATIDFTGGITVSLTSGTGFAGTGGGNIAVSGSANTIANTGGTAISVVGTAGTHFAGNQTWKSVSASNGAKGVSVQFLDGNFTITGDNATPTSLTNGGTISTMTTRGIELINVTGSVSINHMTLNNAATSQTVTGTNCGGSLPTTQNNLNCNAAIHMVNLTGSGSPNVTLNRLLINGSVQGGINGNAVNNLVMSDVEVANVGNEIDENGITLKNLTGNGSASNLNLHDNEARQLFLINTGNNDLTSFPITGGTFANAPAPNGGQGILLQSHDAGTSMAVSVSGANFHDLFTNAFQVACNAGTFQNATVSNSTFTNVNSWVVDQASGGNLTYSIQNNTGSTGPLSGSGAISIKTDNFPAHWDPKLRIPRGQVVAAASIVSPKY